MRRLMRLFEKYPPLTVRLLVDMGYCRLLLKNEHHLSANAKKP
jgi:hypothetical protein